MNGLRYGLLTTTILTGIGDLYWVAFFIASLVQKTGQTNLFFSGVLSIMYLVAVIIGVLLLKKKVNKFLLWSVIAVLFILTFIGIRLGNALGLTLTLILLVHLVVMFIYQRFKTHGLLDKTNEGK